MAWVRPKPKKQQAPADPTESLRPMLHFLSGRPCPKPTSRARVFQNSPPADDDVDRRDWNDRTEPEELSRDEEYNPHAFSFTRDRLVPLPSKPKKSKVGQRREFSEPPMIPPPRSHYTREASPPPPPRSRARTTASHRTPPLQHHVTSEPTRSISSRWASATTPLRL